MFLFRNASEPKLATQVKPHTLFWHSCQLWIDVERSYLKLALSGLVLTSSIVFQVIPSFQLSELESEVSVAKQLQDLVPDRTH